jgi:hypothetical protein
MYAIIKNNEIVEWPIYNLPNRFPDISFPKVLTKNSLPENIVKIEKGNIPLYDPNLEKLNLEKPIKINTVWVEQYSVVPLDNLELNNLGLADNQLKKDEKRRLFQSEADPLFFKWQRGEATKEEWLNKVNEINSLILPGDVKE